MPALFEYAYRVVPLNLTPGLTNFELPIDAEKIVYASPTDGPEITIRLQLQANDAIPLRPQGELVAPFQRLYITAPATPKTIYLLIGSPKDIQLTGRDVAISGTINAKTLEHYAALQGQLYAGSLDIAAVAAQYSIYQILNPSTSGKNALITSVSISNNAGVNKRYFMAGDTTARGLVTGSFTPLQISGPASSMEQRFTNSGSPFGVLTVEDVNALNGETKEVTAPVLLIPGKGLNIRTFNVNEPLTVNLRFFEFVNS